MEGRKMIKWVFTGVAIAVVVGYSLFVLYGYFRGPQIIITSPENGFSTTTPVITITGRSIHTNNLAINGSQTAVDLDGNFRGQLILAPGYNIIKVTAKDNYERIVEKTIETVLVVPAVDFATTTATSTEVATTTINQF